MSELLIYISSFLHSYLRVLQPGGAKALAAENAALRHQLAIITRGRKRAPNLELRDRILLGLMVELVADKRLEKIAAILKPKTLLKFHKSLVDQKYKDMYSNKTRGKPGPKALPKEIVKIIIEMKQRNPPFGCRKIAQMVNFYFDLNICHNQVYRILIQYDLISPDDGPSWLSFLGNIKDSLWSVDFFRCESATLKSHCAMVVMDQHTRRIVGFAVHEGSPSGPDACRMFGEIIKQKELPKHLSSDNDPIFEYRQWQANLRTLDIEEIKSIPYTPQSHPFIERVIGTVRREYLDNVLFWNKTDLQKKLDRFKRYYNESRTHYSLEKHTPQAMNENSDVTPLDINNFSWKSNCRGLFHTPKIS